MRVINADGSQPEMCGNGLRCFIHFVVDELGISEPDTVVETGAGALPCSWRRNDSGEFLVRVSMGVPTWS